MIGLILNASFLMIFNQIYNNITMIIERQQINAQVNPTSDIVNYLKKKCSLPQDQIQKKLLNGQSFDMIEGEGIDLDTKLIQQVLVENDFYEKQSIKLLRDEAMKFVIDLVDEWSKKIAKNQMRINQDQIHNYTAKLLPFGSYILDLKSNTSDIDLICVCPNFIQRQTHFFNDLATKIIDQIDVRNLATRPNAKVPIITFTYKAEIQIDISFCQLNKETVPRDIEKNISTDLLNSTKDDQSRTSLLGRKNNLMILEQTGRQLENFKQTLRYIKVWAKNRGISSNAMGYLGGISWAILVCKICQLLPNHKPSKLLQEFFVIYSLWNWSKVPVRIVPSSAQNSENTLMYVATPASEYNSTQRVNTITFKVIQEEIRRAVANVYPNIKDYGLICRKMEFFNNYNLFVEIDICGISKCKEDEKDFKDYAGFIESRVLKLIQLMYKHHKREIDEKNFKVVPNPKLLKKNDKVYDLCKSIFFGLEISSDASINLTKAVRQWCMSIESGRVNKKSLNIRIFEGTKEDFEDVQIDIKKKKEEKEDPRLAARKKKTEMI